MTKKREILHRGSDHYKLGEIEPIDYMFANDLGEAFCLACIIKYATRCRHSGKMREDLEKIKHYADFMLERLPQDQDQSPPTQSPPTLPCAACSGRGIVGAGGSGQICTKCSGTGTHPGFTCKTCGGHTWAEFDGDGRAYCREIGCSDKDPQ